MKVSCRFFRFVLCAALCAALVPGGLSALGEAACPLLGDWAFEHAPADSVLRVEADGTAVYRGAAYQWTDSGSALVLTPDGDGEPLTLRYEDRDDALWIYPVTDYVRADESSGFTGTWYVPETPRVCFVFTADGTFSEDTAFSGTYTLDEEAGTFRLDYGGFFDPTVCFYTLEADTLSVAYPWLLVPRT